MDLKESDWKVFRKLREVALERYCQRALNDVRRSIDNHKGSYHDSYLKLWDLLRDRDKIFEIAFDNPRRSQALIQLANIDGENLLTDAEVNEFSEELRERLEVFRSLRNS